MTTGAGSDMEAGAGSTTTGRGSMKNQTAAVLDLLRAHPEGVTPLQALYAVGTFRLPARLWELRQMGYRIAKKPAGDGVWVYSLTAEPEQVAA